MKIKVNKQLVVFTCIVLTGLAIRIVLVNHKDSVHVDESISLALVNDMWPNQSSTSYKGRWLPAGDVTALFFDDAVAARSIQDLIPAISMQTAGDVHPPLYYWLLLLSRKLFGAESRIFAPFMLNLFFYLVSSVLLLGLCRKLRLSGLMTAAVLLSFAFARGSVSSTVFFRMYEQLQCCVLLYAYSVLVLLQEDGSKKIRVQIAAYTGLFLAVCFGMLTHYYMLFVIVAFSMLSLFLLVRQRRHKRLGLAVVLTLLALYMAFRVFPPLAYHLFGSYRSTESSQTLFSASLDERLWRVAAYVRVLSRNLFPVPACIVLILIGFMLSRVLKLKKTMEDAAPTRQAALLPGLVVLFLFLIISLSAPYQTGRYLAAYLPLFILASAALLPLVLKANVNIRVQGKTWSFQLASLCMLLLALSAAVPLLHHSRLNGFHEDYTLDADAYYLHDEYPVLLYSSKDAYNWKNMLIYANIDVDKKIFIREFMTSESFIKSARQAAGQSGSDIVYLVLDDYLTQKPPFLPIGYYGFFEVYRLEL